MLMELDTNSRDQNNDVGNMMNDIKDITASANDENDAVMSVGNVGRCTKHRDTDQPTTMGQHWDLIDMIIF